GPVGEERAVVDGEELPLPEALTQALGQPGREPLPLLPVPFHSLFVVRAHRRLPCGGAEGRRTSRWPSASGAVPRAAACGWGSAAGDALDLVEHVVDHRVGGVGVAALGGAADDLGGVVRDGVALLGPV